MGRYTEEEEAELTRKHEERVGRVAGQPVVALHIDPAALALAKEIQNMGFHGKASKIIAECAGTGEPVFILRAKDLLAVLAATEYLRLIETYGCDPEIQEGVHTAINTMKEWQRSNPDKVKMPD